MYWLNIALYWLVLLYAVHWIFRWWAWRDRMAEWEEREGDMVERRRPLLLRRERGYEKR